jgi:hypothetical protein
MKNPCFVKIVGKRPWSFGATGPKLEDGKCTMFDVENCVGITVK